MSGQLKGQFFSFSCLCLCELNFMKRTGLPGVLTDGLIFPVFTFGGPTSRKGSIFKAWFLSIFYLYVRVVFLFFYVCVHLVSFYHVRSWGISVLGMALLLLCCC